MIQRRSIVREKPDAGKPGPRGDRNLARPPGIESARVLTKRGRGQAVDVVIGIGHSGTSPEHIVRDLACIACKGVRTAVVREIAGYPSVVSRKLPAGMFALRTADRITAYRSEAGLPIVVASVPCAATAVRLAE